VGARVLLRLFNLALSTRYLCCVRVHVCLTVVGRHTLTYMLHTHTHNSSNGLRRESLRRKDVMDMTLRTLLVCLHWVAAVKVRVREEEEEACIHKLALCLTQPTLTPTFLLNLPIEIYTLARTPTARYNLKWMPVRSRERVCVAWGIMVVASALSLQSQVRMGRSERGGEVGRWCPVLASLSGEVPVQLYQVKH
jgi:hypothetical protein